jgi:hypothetical protein
VSVTLVIGRTWDGDLLDVADRTTLRLTLDDASLRIEVDAPYAGDPAPAGPPGATDRLWEHEVVELFVAGPDERYTEIELGPHGHHLGLRLDGIRTPVQTGFPIAFEAGIEGGRWTGTAVVARELLPERPARCNAYRIGGGRHEALVAVPGPAPDFHRLDRFVPWPL